MAILSILALLLIGPWCVGSGLAWLRLRTEQGVQDATPPARAGESAAPDQARGRVLPPAA